MTVRQVLLLPLLALVAAAAPPSYRMSAALPGPDGGWDYAAVDPAAHRLFVARGSNITAFDLMGAMPPRSLGTIARAHAAVPVPNSALVLVTSGNDASVRLLDIGSGAETARITVGEKPDAAILDAGTGHAFVANAKDGTVSDIDVRAAKAVRTFRLKPGLEFEAVGAGHILFVNNEDANEIETVDLGSGATGSAIPLPGCEGPSGLAYDRTSNVLISACANGKAAIVDASSRKLTRLVDIGSGPDAVLLDEMRRIALIPCGRDGVLEILALDGPAGVRKIGSVKTEAGARTGAIDPATGRVYLPTASFAPPATAGGRPVPAPGSFHVLVLSPS
ncbi:MAG TPA: gluconolactonase [Sphingomonas sp.]|nr:gluconolactonase [Sphingomonas sp.]